MFFMADELPFSLLSKGADRWAVIATVLYKLGGWFIFSAASVLALWIVWTSREATTSDYITELRESRDTAITAKQAAYAIIAQNNQVLERVVKNQEEATRTQQELVIELKRRNDRGLPLN